MPETIRAANVRLRSRPRRGGFFAACVIAISCALFATPVHADIRFTTVASDAIHRVMTVLRQREITLLTFILALFGFALLTIVILLRARRATDRVDADARDRVAALQADIDRAKALLLSEPQVFVTWAAAAEQPEIIGEVALLAPGGIPERILAFGTWLEPQSARRMEQAVAVLRNEGRSF